MALSRMLGHPMIQLLCHVASPMREVKGGTAVTRQYKYRTISKEETMRLGRLRWLPTLVGVVGVAGLLGTASSVPARADEPLVKYNANTSDYWQHPPADWFMGDETAQQHGTRPYPQ